ncbi:MAG: filamentous hemagglutinin N-terminal domain-containing protein [Verrucomicrobiales bacterium]|nr:filamentous hemagglutinin N-terminal domain-containing protein [Verrucomicrobiales bacterium]
MFLWNQPLNANPSGAVIAHGDISFAGSQGNLQINQLSQRAIINWDDFSIDAGELAQFNQPGASAAILNRITGGNPTEIHGALRANGNVFVINPNGILIGPGGMIDTNGLVLSTLNVSDGEFLAGGDMEFKGAGEGVTNLGRINAIGGDVFLIGKTVRNSGSISARGGLVGMAAGEEVLLKAAADVNGERIFVRAGGAGVSGTGILNDGTIEGAAVELKAHGNIYALAINNKGSIRATGATNSGGRVVLHGVGGAIHNSGSIRATAPSVGNSARVLIEAAYAKVDGEIIAEGGEIRIAAEEELEIGGSVHAASTSGAGGSIIAEARSIELSSTAEIDASGVDGGGQVMIGGGLRGDDAEIRNAETLTVADGVRITADSLGSGSGNAGTVVLWSDDETLFGGAISATAAGVGNGGFVEVSGRQLLDFRGVVSTLSAGGENGTLLLDPTDFEVVTTVTDSNQISNTALIGLLASNNVAITTSDPGSDPEEAGTITIDDGADVSWNSGNSLSLLAHQDIDVRADVLNAGTGSINLIAGWDGTTNNPGAGDVSGGSVITASSFLAGEFGINNGTVTIGSDTQRVAVGSSKGTTDVAAGALVIQGSDVLADAGAQLGFFYDVPDTPTPARMDTTGHIIVRIDGGNVSLSGGEENRSFAQLGHGGLGAGDNRQNGLTNQSISITFVDEAGDVLLSGGEGTDSYAQIGHGSRDSIVRNRQGHITIQGFDDIVMASGLGEGAMTMIGNGGFDVDGINQGNITLTGTGTADANAEGDGGSNITILAGIESSEGADDAQVDSFSQIGNGGHSSRLNKWGNITISEVNDLTLAAGSAERNYVQVGHGGYDSDSNSIGDITISMAGALSLSGGTDSTSIDASAQLGHGGRITDGTRSGNITVTGASSVTLNGGAANSASAHIGHGGQASTGAVGSAGIADTITITTSGDIDLNAGVLNTEASRPFSSWVMIGMGGRNADGVIQGNIVLNAGGDITLDGGFEGISGTTPLDEDDAWAMIGNGGHDSDGTKDGNILIDAANVKLNTQTEFQQGDYSSAQIGHGGRASTGNIGTTAGLIDIDVTGGIMVHANDSGDGNIAYGQIGHGGFESGGSGETIEGSILLNAQSGSIEVSGGLGGAWGSYSQVGFGGRSSNYAGDGDITVNATLGSVSVDGGDSTDGYAQIGHGGIYVTGTQSGNIAVRSGTKVSIEGGSEENAYSQIGHGGLGANANLSGDIHLDVGSALTVTGGVDGYDVGTEKYALLGHGGILEGFDPASPTALTTGSRQGDILLNVGGATAITDRESIAFMGHLGTATVSAGSSFALITDQLDTSDSAPGITGTIQTMGNGGRVEIGVTGGDLDIDGSGAFLDSADQVNLFASGEVEVSASVLNGGSGAVNLVGGWFGQAGLARTVDHGSNPLITELTIDFSAIKSDEGNYGSSGNGVVVGDGNQLAAIAVGSAGGETNVLGYEVEVNGSNAAIESSAQVGFNEELFAAGRGPDGISATGAITVFSKDGGLSLEAGNRAGSFSQVGHGGADTAASFGGALVIDLSKGNIDGALRVAGDGEDSYAQIGHGGNGSAGTKGGSINLIAASAHVEGGYEENASARIGHGGIQGSGDISGDVILEATTRVVALEGGSGDFAEAAIGAGGYQYNASEILSATSVTSELEVTVSAGTGMQANSQIGAGGSESTVSEIAGDIAVTSGGDIDLTGGSDYFSFSQIGNGGASASGNFTGMINVVSGNDISLTATNAESGAYAKIGHGDDFLPSSAEILFVSGGGDRSGNINVSASADIALSDGMIGHVNSVALDAGVTGSGITQIAVSTSDPTDPTQGSLVADSNSEFAGPDELRIYLPERSNNEVEAGVLMNAVSFAGGETDPSLTQGEDEFTVNITGVAPSTPGEHGNVFGSGFAPTNAGRFAFYYNSIELTDSLVVESAESGSPIEVASSPFTLADFLRIRPEDRAESDWLREKERLFSGFNAFAMYYEGYEQYDVNGNPVYQLVFSNHLGAQVRIEVGFGAVLSIQDSLFETGENIE